MHWSPVAATFLAFGTVSIDAAASPPANYRDELIVAANSVRAWQIECETVAPKGAARGYLLNHDIFAVRDPGSIYYMSSKCRVGSGNSWQQYPLQEIVLISGGSAYRAHPNRRSFELFETDENQLAETLSDNFFWYAITWWPIAQRNFALGENESTVIDALESDKYSFREDVDFSEGVACYVLECPGQDALWFDASRIGILHARELYDDSGTLYWRIELSKHKEIETGVWCPMMLRNMVFDHLATTSEGQTRTIIDATLGVVDVRLNNDVADELFDIPEPEPGSLQIFSATRKCRQVVPGGYDFMDYVEGQIRRNIPVQQSSASPLTRQNVIHILIMLVSASVFVFCRRSWRAKRFVQALSAEDRR